MQLIIDHVTIAAATLEQLVEPFTQIGLAPHYGGKHSNGITHMSLLGFADGTYLELISSLDLNQRSPWWHEHIINNGGFCAWAVISDDITGESARINALGVPVDGPRYFNRARPDGLLVEWDLAFPGAQPIGAKLPFLINDRTPRHYRVKPSQSTIDAALTGINKIILAVNNLADSIELFQQVYQWSQPSIDIDNEFGAQIADFIDTPVLLAAPLSNKDNHSWLYQRLQRFGESPCGCLLASSDVAQTRAKLALLNESRLSGHSVCWFEQPGLKEFHLGLSV